MPYFIFLLKKPATTEIYTLSLHDALPIFQVAKDPDEMAQRVEPYLLHVASSAIMRTDDSSAQPTDRKSTRLNSSHVEISYAVFCLKKKIDARGYRWQNLYPVHHPSSHNPS